MGLLDEAIREHLELKRRHGADAAEVARLEQEALGPARRTPADAAAPAVPPAADAPEADDQELFAEAPSAAPEPPTTAHAPVVEDDYVFEGHDEFDEADSVAEVPPAVEPPPAAPIAEPERTVEFEPASEEEWADDWDEDEHEPGVVPPADRQTPEADAAAGEKSEEDVLEETPEFLQETPEHDRLWFEQKPPRDFEF